MNITPKAILKIRQIYPELTGKYKTIADYILHNYIRIIEFKVKKIAKECSCDDALIIRFFQKIGYSGFSELKISIAGEFIPINIYKKNRGFLKDDSFNKLKQDFLDNYSKVIHDTFSFLKEEDLESSVDILSKAKERFKKKHYS